MPWALTMPTTTTTMALDTKMKHFGSIWCLREHQVSGGVCLGCVLREWRV